MTTNNQETSDLIGQRSIRVGKVEQLRSKGINPYPAKSNRTHMALQIHNDFQNLENQIVTVAGRVVSLRKHGKLIFSDIRDYSGSIQLYIKNDELQATNSESQTLGFDDLELVDTGDIVEATGMVTKTQRGEVSILVRQFKMLTKSIRPMPTELEDKEERYRRRYLDMQLHPEIRERFARRTQFWNAIREFLNSKEFLEINIPVLEHVTGGADANPFVTHYDALNQDFYLRISHELPLKKLLGAGFEKVYDIGPRFRNEGISDEHLPEHVAMEFYWAYADAKDGMELTKELYRYVMQQVYGTSQFEMKGFRVDLNNEWEEIDFVKVIQERFGVDVFNDAVEKMIQILKENGVELEDSVNRSRAVDNLWKLIRKTVGGPAFLINVPKYLSPLAKSDPNNPELTQRFHPIIAGSELANAFGELNDPIDQLERFLEQQNLRESGDNEAHMLDIDFVEMLEYGMPPAVGFGLSERVFWFFENVSSKEGVPFPQLKHVIDQTTKKIYPQVKFETHVESHNDSSSFDIVNLETIPTSQIVTIDGEVSNKLPGIKTGYIVLEGVNVEKSNNKLDMLVKSIEKVVKSKFDDTTAVKQNENIAGFREIFKQFGVDPNSRLNSAEAIIRRIVQGKGFYNVNTVVDLYNVTSAEYALPMAAYDLDKIEGQIVLRFAKENETITKIGEEQPTEISKGELVYSDNKGVICLDYNYRDSDRTKITTDSKNIIVFVDGHNGIDQSIINHTLSVIAGRLEAITGGKVIGKGLLV